jgi:membrane protein
MPSGDGRLGRYFSLLHKARGIYVSARNRFKNTRVGRIWFRLDGLGFWNSSLRFSAVFTLFFIPFLLLASGIVGFDLSRSEARRSGLTPRAASDLNVLFLHGHSPGTTITVIGVILTIAGADAMAEILQDWYNKVFNKTQIGWKAKIHRVRWLGGVIAFIALQVLIGRRFEPVGGGLATRILEFVLAVLFWWWSLHCLLLGQIGWRDVLPAGIATAILYEAVGIYIRVFGSSSIVSSEASYGPIGVVMTLLAVLVWLGVGVHVGAVLGSEVDFWQRSMRRRSGLGNLGLSDLGDPKD